MITYLVTGGYGFIGSNFILQELEAGNKIINIDSLSYASDLKNLDGCDSNPNYIFVELDICNEEEVGKLLRQYNVDAIINFAAESHVDNSIKSPEIFIQTNVMGTFHLLWAALAYWKERDKFESFRFLHISTDEVYGDLELDAEEKFSENTCYNPSSPYSASKAASDHLVRAWHCTYGLPIIITNCSNNFGPRQNHEKLIPHMISCAINGKNLPVYGAGQNIRDWIYVEDHCRGIKLALEKGKIGESYCLGGNTELANIIIVKKICDILDEIHPRKDKESYHSQISFVEDRLGHDKRYAIDDTKAKNELGYQTKDSFDDNFKKTISWFLEE